MKLWDNLGLPLYIAVARSSSPSFNLLISGFFFPMNEKIPIYQKYEIRVHIYPYSALLGKCYFIISLILVKDDE